MPLAYLYTLKLLVDVIASRVGGGAAPGAAINGPSLRSMLLCVGFAAGIAVVQSLTTAAQRWIGEAQAQAVTDTMFGILHSKSVEVDLGSHENPAFKDKLHRAQYEAPYRPKRIARSLLDLTLNAVTLLTMAGLLFAYHGLVLPILVVSSVPRGPLAAALFERLLHVGTQSRRARAALGPHELGLDVD